MAWDPARPAGDRPFREGDDRIRENFNYIEAVVGAEHDFGAGSGNTGTHLLSVGTIGARPVSPKTGMVLLRTDLPAIDYYDGTEWRTIYTLPLGSVIGFTGVVADIPDGWELCDSERTVNGVAVPDLRDRFIVGLNVGVAAGFTDAPTVTLAAANVPEVTTAAAGGHAHNIKADEAGGAAVEVSASNVDLFQTDSAPAHTHTVGEATPDPADTSHEFYTMAMICFVGA